MNIPIQPDGSDTSYKNRRPRKTLGSLGISGDSGDRDLAQAMKRDIAVGADLFSGEMLQLPDRRGSPGMGLQPSLGNREGNSILGRDKSLRARLADHEAEELPRVRLGGYRRRGVGMDA